MKSRLIIAFAAALMLSCPSFAGNGKTDDSTVPTSITLKKGEFLNESGKIIKPKQMKAMLPEDLLDAYKKGTSQYWSGYVLDYMGGFLIGSGLGSLLYNMLAGVNNPIYNDYCLYSCLVGVPLLIAGIPLEISGNKKLHAVEQGYNESSVHPAVQMTFGATPSGIGFSIRF